MGSESSSMNVTQPNLFIYTESTTGAVELFPAVWGALENLTDPHLAARKRAVERLEELGAARVSPLVAYMLATRLVDPDIQLRSRVARILGDVLSPDEHGQTTPDNVCSRLNAYLAQMRIPAILDLIEIVINKPALGSYVARLLNACPYAGDHLAEILADRKIPLPVRDRAARFIGMVGFLDAIPALERMQTRLETRLSGQQAMPFAPPPVPNETDLLPAIQVALDLLRAS
ncbi:MAG: hypothetical protein EHM70_06060 [Chloroflexota bacterium]|nr:MAG: hypothetical protein EHM70_06060 [Chloroflexota bacterium]